MSALAKWCLALVGFLLLAGCDPFEREGTWSLAGVNDQNLRLMVADPEDLIRGRGADVTLGRIAADPVERMLRDQDGAPTNAHVSAQGMGHDPQP